ncbi:MAG: hypothetical protein Q9169_004468 [Polycauliona sp. 2 TL-2023]
MANLADPTMMQMPAPNYVDPPSNAYKYSIADSVGLALAFVCVSIRCFTKLCITKAPGWDDFALLVSFLIFVAYVTLDFMNRFQYGGGRHSWDIPFEMLNGNLVTDAVASYLYVLGTMMAKISLLIFLYRIFWVSLKFRLASWALAFMLVVWTLVSFLLMIFACRPVKASWSIPLLMDPNTVCEPKPYNVFNIHGFCVIITDFALLFLPVPMLFRLQMNLKKKIGVAFVFGTGSL